MLEVRALETYYGKAHVLSDLSFRVGTGQVVSLLGRNGAGKSTTLKSIMQLVVPRSGAVVFDGQELIGLAPYRVVRMGLGYVPEDRRIFSDLTVLENLEVGRRAAQSTGAAWSRDLVFELFPNLAERRGNRGKELSGGEQQMLSIARTLMGNPRLLLLDEPSEGIAPVIVEQMAAAILKLRAEGVTVLLSEQNLNFAQIVATHAVVLETGRRRFAGSIEELRAQPEIRDAYLAV